MFMQSFIKIIALFKRYGQFLYFRIFYLCIASTKSDEKWHLVRSWARAYQYQCVCKRFYRNIPKGSRDRACFTFIGIWTMAMPRLKTNGIWQSLGLDLLNINDFAKFHRKISHASRTYVTYENMMSYVRAYVTHENMMFLVKNDVTYENVMCPI